MTVSDLGDTVVNGASEPIRVTDKLPPGITATGISSQQKGEFEVKCPGGEPPVPPLTCTYAGVLSPYEQLSITTRKVKVSEQASTSTPLPNEVDIEGGGGVSDHVYPAAIDQL